MFNQMNAYDYELHFPCGNGDCICLPVNQLDGGFLSFWVPSLWWFLSFHGRYSMLINVGRMKGSRAKGPNNIIWQNS